MGIEKSNRLERGPWGPGASWRFLIPSVGVPGQEQQRAWDDPGGGLPQHEDLGAALSISRAAERPAFTIRSAGMAS